MTPDELAAILARAEAATPGPWEVYPTSPPVGSSWLLSGEVSIGMMAPKGGAGSQDHLADAEFCAHARTDVPALVAEVRRVEEERDAFSEAMRVRDDDMREELQRHLASSSKLDRTCQYLKAELAKAERERDEARAALAAARALCGEAADVTENVFTVASARLRAEAAKGEA